MTPSHIGPTPPVASDADHGLATLAGYLWCVLGRSSALVLVTLTLLPFVAGAWRAVIATRGPERHVCVCPIDADGNCQCPECIRLALHAPRDDHDHDHDEPAGRVITSRCETPVHGTPPPAFDGGLLHELPALPVRPFERASGPRWCARAPDRPEPDPEVPPPRPA